VFYVLPTPSVSLELPRSASHFLARLLRRCATHVPLCSGNAPENRVMRGPEGC
jgi:hypothetical protein